jgi:hypothetical protein
MDALVEDYFRYDELAQMEAEAIRHNITGSGTKVLEYSKRFDNNTDQSRPIRENNPYWTTLSRICRVLV